MSTAPLLEVRGIGKRFGGLQAVRDLSFEMARGEVLGGDPPRGMLRTWSGLDGCSHKQRTEWRGSASPSTLLRAPSFSRMKEEG